MITLQKYIYFEKIIFSQLASLFAKISTCKQLNRNCRFLSFIR